MIGLGMLAGQMPLSLQVPPTTTEVPSILTSTDLNSTSPLLPLMPTG